MKTEKKTGTKSRKNDKPTVSAYYSREDIESILTTVMLASTSIAALLLTLSIFITALKH
jgi:hypothetical protein